MKLCLNWQKRAEPLQYSCSNKLTLISLGGFCLLCIKVLTNKDWCNLTLIGDVLYF